MSDEEEDPHEYFFNLNPFLEPEPGALWSSFSSSYQPTSASSIDDQDARCDDQDVRNDDQDARYYDDEDYCYDEEKKDDSYDEGNFYDDDDDELYYYEQLSKKVYKGL